MFEYRIILKENHVWIEVKGRIDGISAPQLEKVLEEIILDGGRTIVVNLQELNYISSLGLRVFLRIQKKLSKTEGEIIIQQPTGEVLQILHIAGFDKFLNIILTSDVSLPTKEVSEQKIEFYRNMKVTSQNYKAEKGQFQTIGNADKLITASYRKEHVIELQPEEIQFGFGLTALGSEYEQYKHYFGESLIIDHDIIVYPAVEKSAVDIMIASSESYKFLNGLAFSGDFSQIYLLEAKESFINLENFVEFVNEKNLSENKGVIFFAESKGIWGMNLKKVPIESDIENIFSRNSIMQWLNFPIEATDYNSLILGVGIISNKNGSNQQIFASDSNFHIHGAIIKNEILNKSFTSFRNEWKRLLPEAEISGVQHLMGKSQFNCILAGIIDL